MCVFVSRPMKIVTFLRKNDYPPKRVVDFPRERDTFRNKIMEIVKDFDEKSDNNNGKSLKSSRILRVNPFFSFSHFFFIFPVFFFFSNFSFFFIFQSFSFIFLSFSFIFFHSVSHFRCPVCRVSLCVLPRLSDSDKRVSFFFFSRWPQKSVDTR